METIERKVKNWMLTYSYGYHTATALAEAAAMAFNLNQPEEDIPEWIYELAIDILPAD